MTLVVKKFAVLAIAISAALILTGCSSTRVVVKPVPVVPKNVLTGTPGLQHSLHDVELVVRQLHR